MKLNFKDYSNKRKSDQTFHSMSAQLFSTAACNSCKHFLVLVNTVFVITNVGKFAVCDSNTTLDTFFRNLAEHTKAICLLSSSFNLFSVNQFACVQLAFYDTHPSPKHQASTSSFLC